MDRCHRNNNCFASNLRLLWQQSPISYKLLGWSWSKSLVSHLTGSLVINRLSLLSTSTRYVVDFAVTEHHCSGPVSNYITRWAKPVCEQRAYWKLLKLLNCEKLHGWDSDPWPINHNFDAITFYATILKLLYRKKLIRTIITMTDSFNSSSSYVHFYCEHGPRCITTVIKTKSTMKNISEHMGCSKKSEFSAVFGTRLGQPRHTKLRAITITH